MSANILSFVGWTFLPEFITNKLQTFYYTLSIRAGEPRPPPNSPRFVRDRRVIYSVVVITYLLYTLYEAHWEIRRDGDFYSALGVAHDADDKSIQSRFRRLTLVYHPDKVSSPDAKAVAEAQYIYLTLAKDTLIDPAKRFAYDRFGPSMVQWRDCITIHNYVMVGLRGVGPYYIGSIWAMVLLGYLGYLTWGTYWRWLAVAAMAAFELHTLTRPDFPRLIPRLSAWLIPPTSLLAQYNPQPYLPFQTLQFAHKGLVTLYIALSRLGPLLSMPLQPGTLPAGATDEQKLLRQVNRLEKAANLQAMEAQRQLGLELVPFTSAGSAAEGKLREQIQEWLVTNAVRNDKAVRDAVTRVVDRHRPDAEP